MKLLLLAGIIAIAYAPLLLASNINKVRLINADTLIVSEDYCTRNTYKSEVVPVNKTSSRLLVHYDVIKDFPLNSIFRVEVFRSNSGCEKYKKIGDYTVSLCNNRDVYFKYLPNEFIELNKEGVCLPKGRYRTCDHQYFKFYDLLSKEELENACFRIIHSIVTEKEVLYSILLEFVSN